MPSWRTRAQSEDFVCAELTAVQRFEESDSLLRQYDSQLRSHVNAPQDECREHVGQRIRCERSSSMPSLKNPVCVKTICNKP